MSECMRCVLLDAEVRRLRSAVKALLGPLPIRKTVGGALKDVAVALTSEMNAEAFARLSGKKVTHARVLLARAETAGLIRRVARGTYAPLAAPSVERSDG